MDSFPGIHKLLIEVDTLACELDSRISTRDLRIEASKHRVPGAYYGWAYPCQTRTTGRRVTYHKDGLVRLFFGNDCNSEDAIRLHAHELRHIGQFHGGRRIYGRMTLQPMSVAHSERDAEEFEEIVLDRLEI